MVTEFPTRLSFVDERTLAANAEFYILVKDHPTYGLRKVADSGYLINDGPGELTVRSSDDGERYTKEITVKIGDKARWELNDDEVVDTVHVIADAAGASYRSRFARGVP